MIYCFDKRLPWDYSKNEMAISKKNGNGILYDDVLKCFTDYDGNQINITGKKILPRTGGAQIYELNNEIINQGGNLVVSNEQVEIIENWPNYYFNERNSKIFKGHDLIDLSTIHDIEKNYGKEIFIKTKIKNFSGIIPINLLLDNKCAFYKTLLYHLDEDFIISKKVDILEDEYGKKEYRCFVVNNEIYNISRFTTSVFHKIDNQVLEKAQEVIKKLKGIFPDWYVLDLFEYKLDGQSYLDVVEFNPIHSSGLYLYNSCLEKSDDILHSNIKHIAHEFIDKLEECTIEGSVFNDRENLYSIPNSFSSHLRSICATGDIGVRWLHGLNLSNKDFARHDAILKLSPDTEMQEENISKRGEPDLFQDLLDSGLSEESIEKMKQLLKTNKFKKQL